MFPKVWAIEWWYSLGQAKLQKVSTSGKPNFVEFCEKLRRDNQMSATQPTLAFKKGFFQSPWGDFFAISWLVKRSDAHVMHTKNVAKGQGYRLVVPTGSGDTSKSFYERKTKFCWILWKVKWKQAQKCVQNGGFCKTRNPSTSRPSAEKSRGDIKNPKAVWGGGGSIVYTAQKELES